MKNLFKAFSAIYQSEDKRIAAIDEHLTALLGESFVVVEAAGVKGDGVMLESCGRSFAYRTVREVKNEIGMAGSDPYNQGGLSYRKYWAGNSRKSDLFQIHL